MDVTTITEEELTRILQIIRDIRFGSVTLIIQDGRLIQIDKNEKIRLDRKQEQM